MTDLTPEQVAQDMNVSVSHVYALINGEVKVKIGKQEVVKKLPAYKAGGRRYRIRPSELEAFKCAWSNIGDTGASIEEGGNPGTPFILATKI